MSRNLQTWRSRARQLKSDTYAIYLAYRDPRVAWYAKVLAACVVAYALSPIDLIPDFVPVLGYLDDLLLVPLGIALVVRLIPPTVLAECRQQARTEMEAAGPTRWIAAGIILAIWLLTAAIVSLGVLKFIRR